MRKILLVLCLFLITGCDIDYNLKISDGSIVEDSSVLMDKGSIETDMIAERYENYQNFNVPLLKENYRHYGDENKDNSVKYYTVSQIDNSNQIGLHFAGEFNSKVPFSSSYAVNMITDEVAITEDDLSLNINVKNELKVFEEHDNLNDITVNISVDDYKVVNNNADEVVGNNYRWKINRDNYKNKEIILQLNKINSIKDTDKVVKKSFKDVKKTFEGIKNLELIIGCIVLVLVGFILYKFISFKQRISNKF